MFKRGVLIILILIAILWVAMPVLAQGDAPIEPPLPVIPLDRAGEVVMAAILSILVGVVDSPLTTLGVSLLKRIPFLSGVQSNTLQFMVAGMITAAYWASSALGYGVEFNTVAGLLLSIAPALAGLMARQMASAGVYRLAVKTDLGVLGYQRPPSNSPQSVGGRTASRHDYSGEVG